jgi:hypothetical protein
MLSLHPHAKVTPPSQPTRFGGFFIAYYLKLFPFWY